MPGKNSKFDATREHPCVRFVTTRIHIIVLIAVAIVEVWGVTRFYLIYPQLRFSLECISLIMFLLFCDYMTFKGMYKTKNSDPGYLIPNEDGDD